MIGKYLNIKFKISIINLQFLTFMYNQLRQFITAGTSFTNRD